MIETQETRGDFRFRHVGQNHILVYPNPTKFTYSCIAMTGSDVKKFIDIPYFHRIVKLVLIHLDSSYDKSNDSLKVVLEVEQKRSSISPYFTDLLFMEENVVVSEFIEPFGEEFEYEPRAWSLTLNSTSGDLVIPVLYIQKLGGR